MSEDRQTVKRLRVIEYEGDPQRVAGIVNRSMCGSQVRGGVRITVIDVPEDAWGIKNAVADAIAEAKAQDAASTEYENDVRLVGEYVRYLAKYSGTLSNDGEDDLTPGRNIREAAERLTTGRA